VLACIGAPAYGAPQVAVRRRLLLVGHSFVIGLNRRLAHEMARVGAAGWDVVCVAPRRYRADHGWADFAPVPEEPCRALGVRTYNTRSPHLFSYGLELHALLREPWDAVFAWEEPYVLAGAQVAAWTPARTVFSFLTFQNLHKRYPPPFSWLERYVLSRCDGWLYSGHSVYEVQGARPGYRDRVSRLGPLGVDLELFRPDEAAQSRVRRALGWSDDGPPVVGVVGRFVPEKGLHFLMRVLERVTTPHRVLFLGTGPLEKELRKWASLRSDRVRIVSAPHDRVPEFMNALDVLCAPSETARHWREQFGRMIIEGFACAVPVVGSDSGEIPHVVGTAGLVVPERDDVAWLAALEGLLASAERRRELGAKGLERARMTYAWPVVAAGYLGFLAELCERRTQRERG
jgi:phosphatidyl-myo-inositol dimannoside synthase